MKSVSSVTLLISDKVPAIKIGPYAWGTWVHALHTTSISAPAPLCHPVSSTRTLLPKQTRTPMPETSLATRQSVTILYVPYLSERNVDRSVSAPPAMGIADMMASRAPSDCWCNSTATKMTLN